MANPCDQLTKLVTSGYEDNVRLKSTKPYEYTNILIAKSKKLKDSILDIVFAKSVVDAYAQNLEEHLDTFFDKIALL